MDIKEQALQKLSLIHIFIEPGGNDIGSAADPPFQRDGRHRFFPGCVVCSLTLIEMCIRDRCFPVHNSLVGILKDQPVLPGIHHGVFIFIGLLVRVKIHLCPIYSGLVRICPTT